MIIVDSERIARNTNYVAEKIGGNIEVEYDGKRWWFQGFEADGLWINLVSIGGVNDDYVGLIEDVQFADIVLQVLAQYDLYNESVF